MGQIIRLKSIWVEIAGISYTVYRLYYMIYVFHCENWKRPKPKTRYPIYSGYFIRYYSVWTTTLYSDYCIILYRSEFCLEQMSWRQYTPIHLQLLGLQTKEIKKEKIHQKVAWFFNCPPFGVVSRDSPPEYPPIDIKRKKSNRRSSVRVICYIIKTKTQFWENARSYFRSCWPSWCPNG